MHTTIDLETISAILKMIKLLQTGVLSKEELSERTNLSVQVIDELLLELIKHKYDLRDNDGKYFIYQEGKGKYRYLEVLKGLYDQGKPTQLIADEIGMSKNYIAILIRNFIDEGLLTHRPANDKRYFNFKLNDSQRKTIKEMNEKGIAHHKIASSINSKVHLVKSYIIELNNQ